MIVGEMRCDVCQELMTEEEWDIRHWPHDSDCPHKMYAHNDPQPTMCHCVAQTHDECCWECKPVGA